METFSELLRSPGHWQFEIFLMVLFDGLIGMIIWPILKRWFTHHQEDDDKIAVLQEEVNKLKEQWNQNK